LQAKKKGMKYIYYFLLSLWFISASAQKSETAKYLESIGLVNIAEADSSIAIDLMYTRADNFTGKVLYEDLHEAYLHPDAMKGLLQAQQELKKHHPAYRLIVYDAARPMSVQQQMWNVVKGTSKYIYVSNPARGGGLHNYGLAVDISILDKAGRPLPMGTKVDHLGPEAHITNEAALVQSGKITKQEQANRLLLRNVMRTAGFRALSSEWWHFNWCSRQEAKQKYKVIP
jgi:D-alanyl-D-alanine dipeptidase